MDGNSSEFVKLFNGSQVEATLLKGLLEGRGFHPYIESQNIKSIDPFVTGGAVFEVELAVPRSEALSASEVIQELRSQPLEEVPEEIEKGISPDVLGRRLRWSTVLFLGIFPPMAPFFAIPGAVAFALYIALGIAYFLRVKRQAAAPVGHNLTVFCFVLATLFCAVELIAVILALSGR